MKSKLSLLFLCFQIGLFAQGLEGLWEVKVVQIGDQIRTPQAKWIRFGPNGFEGGNGLQQNGAGSYDYDSIHQELALNDSLGFADPNPPFKIYFASDTMTWNREEEGMVVKVTLARVNHLPLRPADKLIGIWKPQEASDSIHFVFIRWDHLYQIRFVDGSSEHGVWQAHSHRVEVVLIPWEPNKKPRSYEIETGPWEELHLKSKNDAALRDYILIRLDQFPN